MYLKSIFGRCFFVLKDFDPLIRVAKNNQEKLTILHVTSHRIFVLLRLTRDFVIRKLVGKQGMNIHAALRRFREI